MVMKLIAVAAAPVTIAACSAQVDQTGAYVYPNSWGTPAASALGSSSVPTKQDLSITLHAPTNMSIFGTHADSPGIWLFPPNQLGGGNN